MKLNPAVNNIFDFEYEDFMLDRVRPSSGNQGSGRGMNAEDFRLGGDGAKSRHRQE